MRLAEDVLTTEKIEEIIGEVVTPFKMTEKEVYENFCLWGRMYEHNTNIFHYDFIDDVEIKFDKRLTSIGGNCRSGSRVIKISPHYIRKYPEELDDIIIHEMIHLEINGHGPDFYERLNEINEMMGRKVVSRYTQEKSNINYITYCPKCEEIAGVYSNKTRGIKHGSYRHRSCGEPTYVIRVNKYL